MLAEGLFDKFPCDEIYGMHNSPGGTLGKISVCKGAAMAGAAFFDIAIKGKGSHAAAPQHSKDALFIAASLATELQSILSRNVPPLDVCVLSVTQIHSGAAYNVVPETAALAGTIRYFKDEIFELAKSRMQAICDGFALAHGVEITVDARNVFDVLQNDPELSTAYIEAAADLVGPENVNDADVPVTGSEDFSDMLKVVPGAYVRLWHGGEASLHNPAFTLDPKVLPLGAALYSKIVETRLAG